MRDARNKIMKLMFASTGMGRTGFVMRIELRKLIFGAAGKLERTPILAVSYQVVKV